jgi:hypothetical protein
LAGVDCPQTGHFRPADDLADFALLAVDGALFPAGNFASGATRSAAAAAGTRSADDSVSSGANSRAGKTIRALQFGHFADRPAQASLLLTLLPQLPHITLSKTSPYRCLRNTPCRIPDQRQTPL